jgi:transcription elongation GreA/GreB family factor
MSRAFVREDDLYQADALPELRVSEHANWVTPRGLEQIDAKIAELNGILASDPDEATAARAARDLRYWTTRKDTAEVHQHDPRETRVSFASRVTFSRDGHAAETLEIVGEDEADPKHGRLSWVAPLARAMLNRSPGDVVTLKTPQGQSEIEILAIEAI